MANVGIWKRALLPGSETFILNQVSALKRWRPFYMGESRVHDGLAVTPDFLLDNGLHKFDRAKVMFRLCRRSKALESFIRSSDIELLHAHFGMCGIDVMPTAARLRMPMIVTFHGVDITRRRSQLSLRDQLYVARLKSLFTYSARLIAVSDFIANQLERAGAPTSKILVHHIGVPVQSPQSSLSRSGVLFVGRLVEKKGALDLLHAVGLLPDQLRKTRVTIIGDGPLREVLERVSTELGIDVAFLGQQKPEVVAEHMRRASVFCVPSRGAKSGDSEGLGMVFLEAAAQQLPVVSTRHGGIPEAVIDGHTGLLVGEGDIRGLAGNLAFFLKNEEMGRSFGRAGRERISRRFEIGKQTELLEKVYDDVVFTWRRNEFREGRRGGGSRS
jgi:colanic acid/amylovoran biosynthesis glycosyltransferase